MNLFMSSTTQQKQAYWESLQSIYALGQQTQQLLLR